MFTFSNMADQLFSWLYYKLIDCLNTFTKYIGDMGADLFDDENIKAILLFFQLLASVLLVVGIGISFSEYAIGAENGRTSIRDTVMNIFKAMMAVALFSTVPIKLYQLSISVENTIGAAISAATPAVGMDPSPPKNFFDGVLDFLKGLVNANPILHLIGSVTGSGDPIPDADAQHIPSVSDLLFIVAFCYGFFKVLFGNIKRGTILLIQICVCPFYIFSLTLGYSDGFSGWCKQIVGLCFTAFLQNLLLTVGLIIFRQQMIIGTGIMLAAAEVPRIAGRYGLDTSAKANISSVTYAASTTMSIVRALSHV